MCLIRYRDTYSMSYLWRHNIIVTCMQVPVKALDNPYKGSFQFEMYSHITIVIPR